MKTRTGFVSNSSSSSFIVAFDKDPKIMKNLEQMMGDCTSDYDSDFHVPSKWEVVERVHEDLKNKDLATEWDIKEEFSNLYSWYQYKEVTERLGDNASWSEVEEELAKITDPMAKSFMVEHKGKFIYILDYADDEGDAAYEHGDIFRNVPHEKVSHH